MIPKSVVKTIGQEGISGIYFEADPSQCQELKNDICRIFDENWKMACAEANKKYGDCLEYSNEWPSGIDVYPWDAGLFITFQALYLSYDGGKKCDTELGIAALENTLKAFADKYPDNDYYGFISFIDLYDNLIQRSFCSPGKALPERFGFMDKVIAYINQNMDSFIDCVKDNCYEREEEDPEGKWVSELIDFLHMYEEKVDRSIYSQIISAACEYIEDDLYYELEEKIESWEKACKRC